MAEARSGARRNLAASDMTDLDQKAAINAKSRRPRLAPSRSLLVMIVAPIAIALSMCAVTHHYPAWPFVFIEVTVAALAFWRVKRLLVNEKHTRCRATEREEYLRAILDNVGDLIVVLDTEGRLIYLSQAAERLFGAASKQLEVGFDFHDILPADRELVEALIAESVANPGRKVVGQVRLSGLDGSPRLFAGTATTLARPHGPGVVVIGMRDVTEQHRLRDKLTDQMMHDALTGMANRTLVLDRCAQMLSRTKRTRTRVAALFVDLDDFKDVNSAFGHGVGDNLLIAVGTRLSEIVREGDTLGRLGSDEFVILTEDDESGSKSQLIAKQILEALRKPFQPAQTHDAPLRITGSIGIARGSGLSAEELIRDADLALYRAKAMGKNRFTVFQTEMYSAVKRRLALEMDLRESVTTEQFFLMYQPMVELASLRVTGVEALLRWRHPIRGVVSPTEFIPVLEESGAIVDIGRWVLQEACVQAAEWQQRGMPLSVSVNLSARQLDSDELVDVVHDALRSSSLRPRSLTLEITETTLMRNTETTTDCLRRLHALGVRIAIDDFGTGYCSFGYLQAFPLDILKIDRSFVCGVSKSEDARTLVRTLVRLGTELGLVTLAEGIENEAQLEELRADGCQAGQGFLFAKPLDLVELEELMAVPFATSARLQLARAV